MIADRLEKFAIVEAGLRDRVKILVDETPATEEFGKRIGAVGYGPDCASVGVKTKAHLKIRS